MNRISLGRKLGYGVGAVGLDLSYGMFYSYLSIYLTNALGISPVFLLILAPLARIWDGINDPMMGMLVDKTKTKMGRYRPWILLGTLLNAVVLCLLFNNPGFASGSVGLYVYAAILYVFWGMTNTLADIPFWSMVPSFATEEKDRNLVSTIARAFSGLGQGIISIFTPIAVAYFGGVAGSKLDAMSSDSLSKGFGTWSVIASVGLIVFAVICVLSTKEKNVVANPEKFSFKAAINVIRSNDQLLVFMLFAMISNAGFYMISGVGAYYFDVVVGDSSNQSGFNTFGAVGSILGLAVIPIMMKFTTRRRTYQFSLLLAIAGYLGMLISAKALDSVTAMGICYLIAQTGTASMFVSQTVFLADIVDYGEYKMGFRAESITFSMKGFLQKMAYTIQTIILYSGLSISHYDGDLHSANPAAAHTSISVMMLVLPMVLMAASLIVFTFKFKLNDKTMKEITAKLAEKN